MNNIDAAIEFYEKFIRSGGVVTLTEFRELNATDQEAYIQAGLLVEKYKSLQLKELIIDVLLPDELTMRIQGFNERMSKR